MASADEFKALLTDIKGILTTKLDALNASVQQVNASTQQVNASVQTVNGTLATGFGQLLVQAAYTNQALHHNAQQNDTMICILEHISKNTCAILNEVHAQTGLQRSMEKNLATLSDLYGTVHAEATLAREKMQALRAQIEECCPPPKPVPPCSYERCPAPGELPKPPRAPEHRPIG